MTRVLAALEELDLVHRQPHPTGQAPGACWRSTDRGRDLLVEDRNRRQAWLACRLNELLPAEREALRLAVPVIERLADS